MQKVWLINYCSLEDWESMHDDGGFDSMADQAHPCGIVLHDIQELADLLITVKGEWMEMRSGLYEDEDEERGAPGYEWKLNIQKTSATQQQWDAYMGNKVMGILVAREVEVQ